MALEEPASHLSNVLDFLTISMALMFAKLPLPFRLHARLTLIVYATGMVVTLLPRPASRNVASYSSIVGPPGASRRLADRCTGRLDLADTGQTICFVCHICHVYVADDGNFVGKEHSSSTSSSSIFSSLMMVVVFAAIKELPISAFNSIQISH